MTDHLPECPTCADPMDCIPNGHYPSVSHDGPALCSKVCICPALRACEQRVREGWYETQSATWEHGYSHGVQAARDAVAAASLRIPYEDRRHVYLDDALAAIDALREGIADV